MLTLARAYVRSSVSISSDEEIEAVGLRAYEAAGNVVRELEEVRAPGLEIDIREGTLSISRRCPRSGSYGVRGHHSLLTASGQASNASADTRSGLPANLYMAGYGWACGWRPDIKGVVMIL